MANKNIPYYFLALFVVGVVIFIIVVATKKKEGFHHCVCTSKDGGRGRACIGVAASQLTYDEGVTEYNPNWPKREWSKISPGDVDFPSSAGCGYPKHGPPGWVSWDFTEFGGKYEKLPGNDCGYQLEKTGGNKENYTYTRNQPYSRDLIL